MHTASQVILLQTISIIVFTCIYYIYCTLRRRDGKALEHFGENESDDLLKSFWFSILTQTTVGYNMMKVGAAFDRYFTILNILQLSTIPLIVYVVTLKDESVNIRQIFT